MNGKSVSRAGRPARARSGWIAFLPPVVLLAVVLATLIACMTPPPPPPTRLQMTVEASPDANPDQAGRPSPVVVRVYELTGPSSFREGDFFQLFEQPEATLGSDLRDVSDVVVAPGGRETLSRELSPDTRYIGILANFRDIDQAQWREGFVVPVHETTSVNVRVGRLDVSVARRGS